MNYKAAFYIVTLLITLLSYIIVVMFFMKWYLIVMFCLILTLLFLWCWFALVDELKQSKQ